MESNFIGSLQLAWCKVQGSITAKALTTRLLGVEMCWYQNPQVNGTRCCYSGLGMKSVQPCATSAEIPGVWVPLNIEERECLWGFFFQYFFSLFSEVASLLIFRVHPFRRACLIVAVCYCCTKQKAEEKLFHCEKCIKYVFNSCCISCFFSGTCKHSKNYLSLFLGKM